MSDDDNTNNTVHHDFPVDTDQQEMLYNDNPASLIGLLHEVDRFYETNGYFQPLITHGAVLLGDGRLAIEHPSIIPFIGAINCRRAHAHRPMPGASNAHRRVQRACRRHRENQHSTHERTTLAA